MGAQITRLEGNILLDGKYHATRSTTYLTAYVVVTNKRSYTW